MKIGMTGTRNGATPEQLDWFKSQLLDKKATELHHGDCIGADEQANQVALELGLIIVIHPPINESRRAFCSGDRVTVLEPKEYLDRNKDIVDATEYLLALPEGPETPKSGTWSTVRYATKTKKPVEGYLP